MSNSEEQLQRLYPDGKQITVRGENFTIKPFVLRNRIQVVKVLASVFGEIYGDQSVNKTSSNELMVKFIAVAGERLVDIYKIVLNKDEEWLQEISMVEEAQIIQAVMEVNEFPFLMGQINVMIAKNQMAKK